MASQRQKRVQELLVQEISDILRREVSDPRIGFVTVTDAEVSPDLRNARVFVSVMGTQEQADAALTALNRAAGFIRGAFGRRAELRFTPTLEFRFDTTVERAARLHELLATLPESDRDAPETAESGGGRDPDGK